MARTKAQKLAEKRRGRPRKEGAREPNGKPSRSGIPHEPADTVAIEARVRHLGITKEQAKDQKAATFIGYLAILGPRDGLSEAQYDAAVAFLELRRSYQRALKSPGAEYDPMARGGDGDDPEAYERWVKGIKERYDAARKAIEDAQYDNRRENLWAALDLVILHSHHMHHLIGATRLVCNALVRHFRIAGDSRVAA